MGMTTFVVGVRDLDGKFSDMLAVKHACEKAGIDYPIEVVNYFLQMPEESEAVLKREMSEVTLPRDAVLISSSDDGKQRFTVLLDKLPKEVKAVKFTLSY